MTIRKDVPLKEPRLAYSIAEAAQLTGLGRTTLYKMMDRGELPTRKIGGRRLIPADVLYNLVSQDFHHER